MANADLQSFIDRMASLYREKKQADEMLADLKKEIDSSGFDKAAVDDVVKRMMMDEAKLEKLKSREAERQRYAEEIGQGSLF